MVRGASGGEEGRCRGEVRGGGWGRERGVGFGGIARQVLIGYDTGAGDPESEKGGRSSPGHRERVGPPCVGGPTRDRRPSHGDRPWVTSEASLPRVVGYHTNKIL